MEIKYVEAPKGATINYFFKDLDYILEQIKNKKDELLKNKRIIFDDVRVSLDGVYENGVTYRLDIIIDEAANKYEIYTGATLVVNNEGLTLVVDKIDARGKMNSEYGEWEEERPVKMINTEVVDDLVSQLGMKVDIDTLKEPPVTGIMGILPKERRKAKERELASLCLEQGSALLEEGLNLLPDNEKKVG